MAITFQLTIDCHDPAALVDFWALALGYVPEPPPAGFATWNAWYRSAGVGEDELLPDDDAVDRIIDPDGTGPRIWFQLTSAADDRQNRIHLDLDIAFTPDGSRLPYAERLAPVRAKADQLTAAGGTVRLVVEEPEHEHFHITMADPEGNVFCLR